MRIAALGLIAGASAKVYFSDQFDDLSNWTPSTWKHSGLLEPFVSKVPRWSDDAKADLAMAATHDNRFYAAAASFDSFSNEGKPLIVQYEAKMDFNIECGGGYLKVGPKMKDLTTFGDPTPYNIMFGPDKCGSRKRTHLIFSYKGKNVLKRDDLPYFQDQEGFSVLYRLTVNTNSTVKVEVGRTDSGLEEVYSGKLEDDWDILEPKQITDPDEKKPEDWVDEAMIDDPNDFKPADWVEVKQIVDPNAKKPADWDVEEDGEWEAPMIANPAYKGEWTVKRISNPAYKGVWEAKKIPNPKYVADENLGTYKDFGFVGFDIWQVKAHAFFDNVIITDDVKEADEFVPKWEKKVKYETMVAPVSTTSTTTEAPEVAPDEEKDDDEDL